jgi:hypothetical protein
MRLLALTLSGVAHPVVGLTTSELLLLHVNQRNQGSGDCTQSGDCFRAEVAR